MNSDDEFNCVPAKCSSLRVKGYVMIRKRPCKIVELSTSRPGKHGHAKVHIVALDVFTGRKYEDISPSTHQVQVPEVRKKDYSLMYIGREFLALMDPNSKEIRRDLFLPDGELGQQIRTAHEVEERDILCTVLSACGEEAVVAMKQDKRKADH